MSEIQTHDCNNNLFKFEDSIVFKNSVLHSDYNWLQHFRALLPTFNPDTTFPENRTIVFIENTQVMGIYSLQMLNKCNLSSFLKVGFLFFYLPQLSI